MTRQPPHAPVRQRPSRPVRDDATAAPSRPRGRAALPKLVGECGTRGGLVVSCERGRSATPAEGAAAISNRPISLISPSRSKATAQQDGDAHQQPGATSEGLEPVGKVQAREPINGRDPTSAPLGRTHPAPELTPFATGHGGTVMVAPPRVTPRVPEVRDAEGGCRPDRARRRRHGPSGRGCRAVPDAQWCWAVPSRPPGAPRPAPGRALCSAATAAHRSTRPRGCTRSGTAPGTWSSSADSHRTLRGACRRRTPRPPGSPRRLGPPRP